MRLLILCEGETELCLLDEANFLNPYLQHFGKPKVKKIRGRSLKAYAEAAEGHLRLYPDSFVFALLDLYEAPIEYPEKTIKSPNPTDEKFKFLQKAMLDEISPRFRDHYYPFPVVQEIETWILADIQAMRKYLHTEVDVIHHPEEIGLPAAEKWNSLMLRYLGKRYVKGHRRENVKLFTSMDARRVYADHCPHFVLLIDQLVDLQKG
jgi:hypothetical protein